MKGRVAILGQINGTNAAALIVDGKLDDLLVDQADLSLAPGAIYRARVDRQIKGQGGVFVRLGETRTGFLRMQRPPPPGGSLLVQVSGYAEPGKAVPLTAKVLFKSRYAIVTPGAPGLNLSRRIRDEALRDALLAIAHEEMHGTDEGTGLILRSACATAHPDDVADDIQTMRHISQQVAADSSAAPSLLLDGPGAHDLAWREWEGVDDVQRDSFAHFGVDEAIEGLQAPQNLPGGGNIVVEPTRACVAVDVNTGADGSPAAALKANMGAARDLPRQLRLRGLGGQIFVDFAPLPKKDRRQIEAALRAAFRADPVETTLAGWTPLGNFELQRKRERLPLDVSRLL